MHESKSYVSNSLKLAIGVVGAIMVVSCSTSPLPNQTTTSPQPSVLDASPTPSSEPIAIALTPASPNWRTTTHIHGIGVSAENPNILYVATHQGLLQRSETGQWAWVGQGQDDLMGFMVDPANPNRFYSSGHPPNGGNLGFRASDDKGQHWEQISMPGMDFHTMAIAPSNPAILYGWAGNFFASRDGGQTWTQPDMTGLSAHPFGLAVAPDDPQHVFATTSEGLYESQDGGNTWAVVDGSQNALLVGLIFTQEDSTTTLHGYRLLATAPGIYQSSDWGKTWEAVETQIDETIVYLTVAPSDSQILYAASEHNTLLKSEDGGKTWEELF
ncbi:hypothetical protein H6G89_27080 [Oscillatoria sp. FACHB-1407]|uniref:F510_1955 family glycosylhydrolase n=1 Tax=Oscillatoria sp. FACHB-1407 TaxID=2692847 RepID=UPI00168226E0|nr:hypothetical protein [Oscillatoria sp. FACHB-1407]MBD2464674.1 hypothetical protein [Oscillatoria sp. FACHB-1407]